MSQEQGRLPVVLRHRFAAAVVVVVGISRTDTRAPRNFDIRHLRYRVSFLVRQVVDMDRNSQQLTLSVWVTTVAR